MITCLENLVGVRGLANQENPDSGYYINDLPGISTRQLEDISDQSDHYEPRLAWDDIFNRSARNLENDIKTHMMPYFKNYSYKGLGITGRLDIDNIALATEDFWNGWYFDLEGLSDNLSVVFDSINLHVVSGTSFVLQIFDVITGEVLFAETFNATSGTNTYRILHTVPLWKHRKLFIAYNANTISVKQVDRFDRNLGTVSAQHVSTGASVIEGNLTGANTGMILNYNTECSIDNFVCQRIDLFKDPFLYKLGIEFCTERIHSERINRFTLLNKEEADELRQEFMAEYKNMMDNIFKDIRVRKTDECFECNKAIMYKMVSP